MSMAIRIIPDEGQPSAAMEIPLEKPLPDYDLCDIEKPTPRDVDAILASQGFRDLLDDARGVLMEILAHPHLQPVSKAINDLDITPIVAPPLEITQLTSAICPDDEEVYRPGLWIVLRDPTCPARHSLPQPTMERIAAAARELATRLHLE
jgi:hypothetical protein